MALKSGILDIHDEMIRWRHDIHAHPETAFEEFRTADRVAGLLQSFGLEVHRGLAKTGVVGTLKVGASNRAIGLRADLDALDIHEENDFDYASKHPGKMHACGHDGHTTMLLGAAWYLAESKRFSGTVHFIFQPAEENVAGGRVMVEEGLFDLFPVEAVYGMHNSPGIAVGKFAVQTGPAMAAADMWELEITGKGSHGAHPHHGVDPIVTASEIVTALQRIVGRSIHPMKAGVVSVTQFTAGNSFNVIPESATLRGTCRAHEPEIRDQIEARFRQIINGVCAAHGVKFRLDYQARYPATINTAEEAERAARAAASIVGEANVIRELPPSMGAEDFAWMLQDRPGCYVRVGNGSEGHGSCVVHNPRYDFNDDALPYGASFWAALVEQELLLESGG
ncbi:MAG: M20 family metallopeptidase [Gammaproteobacteria bacterium]|nr:M20 family metallopeptidase [Gammaproteobacteria bacterium]MDH3411373.1 M20 family metallopeptidase [Gammaproteobacteria bacterium]